MIIEIASMIAACVFNEGYMSILKLMDDLHIKIGSHSQHFANEYDEQGISR